MPVIQGGIVMPGPEHWANRDEYGPFISSGAPASGYLNGTAETGALVIVTSVGTLYQNTGTKAATVWTAR